MKKKKRDRKIALKWGNKRKRVGGRGGNREKTWRGKKRGKMNRKERIR